MSKNKYTWTINKYDEYWVNCIEDNVEDCIKEAVECYGFKSGRGIWVGECIPVDVSTAIDVDDFLETIEEKMYEQIGENAEYWDISSYTGGYANRKERYEQLERDITALIKQYIKDIGEEKDFYTIENIREVTIP